MNRNWIKLLGAMLIAGAPAAVMADDTSITVYTSQPSDQMTQVVQAFNKDYPNIQVNVFRSGTTDLMGKIAAEEAAGKVEADVVLIADAVAMTQLKNQHELYAYKDAPVANLPKDLVDPDMTFFGTKLITTGIIYNTNLVKTPPTSWADLEKPDVAKSLIMPSPLYSGAAVIHMSAIVQDPDLGWDFFQKLADEGAVSGQGNGTILEAVARGEKAYGIVVEYMALNAKAKGSPVDFVFPKEGVTAVTQPVAIVAGSPHLGAAKKFVDWQLSKDAQEQSVQQGYFPVIAGMTPPPGYPPVSSLKILSYDPAKTLADDKAAKQKFSDLFGG
jgi:iron(III) transport system substrate-binding protein